MEIGTGQANKKGKRLFGIEYNSGSEKERKPRYEQRTRSSFVFAFGLNNVITEGESLEDSDFRVAGSRFFELGLKWETKLFNNSNKLALNYGLNFQFNGLKPTDNRFFVDTGDQTELQVSDIDFDKSKLRISNLVVPFHLEFRPTYVTENKENRGVWANRHKFRLGVGGYGGIRLGTLQKLKFDENSENVKQKQRRNFNSSNFVYGLSGYIGFGSTTLYAKYDLNPIFKDNPIEQRNVSLGIRIDTD